MQGNKTAMNTMGCGCTADWQSAGAAPLRAGVEDFAPFFTKSARVGHAGFGDVAVARLTPPRVHARPEAQFLGLAPRVGTRVR